MFEIWWFELWVVTYKSLIRNFYRAREIARIKEMFALEFLRVFYCTFRSSLSEMFCKKGVLRNTAKFTGKHLCKSLFFNKVAGMRPATLLKKRLWHRSFPVNFAKFLRTPLVSLLSFPEDHHP